MDPRARATDRIPDLWHPSAAGHHVATDALAEALVARGLVPPATE